METLIDFIVNNYIWFLVISLIIIFALIGYLVDLTNVDKKVKKKINSPIVQEEENVVKVHPSVEAYTNEVFDDPLIDDENTL